MRRTTSIIPLVLGLSLLFLFDARADDVWVWDAKVQVERVLDRADTIYLLQGELLEREGRSRYVHRGFMPPRASPHPLVLVYRLESMDWPDDMQKRVLRDLNAFADRGNRVWGIQLDFDAATHHLDRYGEFLRRVRGLLPQRFALSVTGLMDWASQGRLNDLNTLKGVVDEVVFQAYQGIRPIKNHRRYLKALADRPIELPFKLGLVEGGDYAEDDLAAVRAQGAYRGTVVFLVSPDMPARH